MDLRLFLANVQLRENEMDRLRQAKQWKIRICYDHVFTETCLHPDQAQWVDPYSEPSDYRTPPRRGGMDSVLTSSMLGGQIQLKLTNNVYFFTLNVQILTHCHHKLFMCYQKKSQTHSYTERETLNITMIYNCV